MTPTTPTGPGRLLSMLGVGWFAVMLVATLQAVIPLGWGGRIAGPDVLLAVVLYAGLQAREGLVAAATLAVLLGYLGDLFGGAPKGLYMLCYLAAMMAARAASSRLLVRGFVATVLVVFFFALLSGLAVTALRMVFDTEVGWGALGLAPLGAAATALVAPFLFRTLARIDRRFVRDPRALRSVYGEGRR